MWLIINLVPHFIGHFCFTQTKKEPLPLLRQCDVFNSSLKTLEYLKKYAILYNSFNSYDAAINGKCKFLLVIGRG